MGVYGFIHAFERKLQSRVSTHFSAFALCLHDYHLQKRGLTKEAVKKSSRAIKLPGIEDGWQCDFTFSLVLKINAEITFDIETILSSLPKRLCRGNVHIKIDDFPYISFLPTFVDAVKHIPNSIGQWLILDSNSQLESVDALLEYAQNKKRLLTCIGYNLLEPPQYRDNSLDKNQHAFCESIIAAVQLTSFKNSTDINQFFWNYHWADCGPVITSARSTNETAESPYIPRFN
jgi:CRISPR-associated protein Csy2